MSHTYEIEIKSLLGNKEKADQLVAAMKDKDTGLTEVGSHKQLNHYFIGGNLQDLYEKVASHLPEEKNTSLKDLAQKAKDFSVRSRWADGKIILVVKASVDDTTSSNGTARLEWETQLFPPSPLEGESKGAANPLDWIDNLILSAGFTYQAKWSRERQEYIYHPGGREIAVSVDKNAGYGYLSEFEVVVNDE